LKDEFIKSHESTHKTTLNIKNILVFTAAMVDPLIILAYNPLVPVLKTAFNVGVEPVALSLTFHMLPFSLLNLFSGTLSDFYFRPRILIYGLLLSSIGSMLGVLSPNILIFSLSRTIQGIGSAFIIPITLALLGDITVRDERGKVMGWYGVFLGLATTLGPLIGGFLALREWRLVPFIFSVYSLITAILVKMVFHADTALSRNRNYRVILHQLREVIKNRNIVFGSIAGFSLFFMFQGVQPFISDDLSLPPLLLKQEEIGVLFSIIGLISIIFSFVGGFIIDKMGSKKSIVIGFGMMLLPQYLLTLAGSYWSYVIWLSLLGGFQRIALISVQTLIIEAMPRATGSASSIFNFARYLGFAITPTLATIYLIRGLNFLFLINLILLLINIIFTTIIRNDYTEIKS
jgi:MFS family permease